MLSVLFSTLEELTMKNLCRRLAVWRELMILIPQKILWKATRKDQAPERISVKKWGFLSFARRLQSGGKRGSAAH
jgi:hypothetical protein